MKDYCLKVTFNTLADNSSIDFASHEEVIVDHIKSKCTDSINIFVNNPMPRNEFIEILSETCERIQNNTPDRVYFCTNDITFDVQGFVEKISFLIQISFNDKEKKSQAHRYLR